MKIREFISRLGNRGSEKKELIRRLQIQSEAQDQVVARTKSANERELERFLEEDREEQIKDNLEYYRKKKDYDVKFNHNPLNVKNITNHTEWEVLKEKNQFASKGNMFVDKEIIHKNNPKLLKNNKLMYGI